MGKIIIPVTIGIVCFVIGAVTAAHNHKAQRELLIDQCEQSLPRNQSCEVVLTAKVKEGK